MLIYVEFGVELTVDLAQLFQRKDELFLARESQLDLSGVIFGFMGLVLMFCVIYPGFSHGLLSFPIEKLVNLLLRLFVGPLSREVWIIFLELGIVLYHALNLIIPRVFDLDFRNGPVMKTSS